ncbi:GntR family transcriptional regulator [Aurantimonas sp. A2-1-M11]|uniref:GntR family transcriptional regulator n=1 Tax=Aurantimonas sp. A2-1-M11 TaxID=3113712 RepID=UPI002F92BC2D
MALVKDRAVADPNTAFHEERMGDWTGSGEDIIVQGPSLGDAVYERLVDDLISLRTPPGERLSVDKLARRFGVSQTPTRAALIRLEAEGLVVKKHLTGYSVAPLPSLARLESIFEMRALVEPRSAARAAEHASPSQRAALSAIAAEMRSLSAEDVDLHRARLVVLDSRFHTTIAEACGNDLIAETLGRLFTQMHIFRLRYHSNVAHAVIDEHVEILDAIASRDAARAEAAMLDHIDAARERLEPHVRRAI